MGAQKPLALAFYIMLQAPNSLIQDINFLVDLLQACIQVPETLFHDLLQGYQGTVGYVVRMLFTGGRHPL